MTYEDMQKRIAGIVEKCDPVDVYTSPDFQCDQTGGFPTSLCVCCEKGKAWLELKENLVIDRDVDLDYYRQLCADFGIRICCANEQLTNCCKNWAAMPILRHIFPTRTRACSLEEFEIGAMLLISGFLFGGFIASALLCCLQINRCEEWKGKETEEKKD